MGFVEEQDIGAQAGFAKLHLGAKRLLSTQTRFGKRDCEPAFGTIVGALDESDSNEGADGVVRAFLLLEVERGGSALFASMDDFEKMRGAKFVTRARR